jgi:hypothetical protein
MRAIFKGELLIAVAWFRPNAHQVSGTTRDMYAALLQRKAVFAALVAKGASLTATRTSGNSAERLQRGDSPKLRGLAVLFGEPILVTDDVKGCEWLSCCSRRQIAVLCSATAAGPRSKALAIRCCE